MARLVPRLNERSTRSAVSPLVVVGMPAQEAPNHLTCGGVTNTMNVVISVDIARVLDVSTSMLRGRPVQRRCRNDAICAR